MNNKIIPLFMAIGLISMVSCGGEKSSETTESTEKTDEPKTEEPAVVKVDPVTTASGSVAEFSKTSGDAKYQTGNDYKFKYTLLDFTTNVAAGDLPIDEFTGPKEGQQLIKMRVEAEVLSLRMLNFKSPLNSFSLFLTEGGDKIQNFTRFSEEFKTGMAPKDLKVGEKQVLDVYFIAPADADLSKAILSLYRGSSEEPVQMPLNKN